VFELEDQIVAVVIILIGANEVVVHCRQQLFRRTTCGGARQKSMVHSDVSLVIRQRDGYALLQTTALRPEISWKISTTAAMTSNK
jgi:hypothetical protein